MLHHVQYGLVDDVHIHDGLHHHIWHTYWLTMHTYTLADVLVNDEHICVYMSQFTTMHTYILVDDVPCTYRLVDDVHIPDGLHHHTWHTYWLTMHTYTLADVLVNDEHIYVV